jgi:hypothetical protein
MDFAFSEFYRNASPIYETRSLGGSQHPSSFQFVISCHFSLSRDGYESSVVPFSRLGDRTDDFHRTGVCNESAFHVSDLVCFSPFIPQSSIFFSPMMIKNTLVITPSPYIVVKSISFPFSHCFSLSLLFTRSNEVAFTYLWELSKSFDESENIRPSSFFDRSGTLQYSIIPSIPKICDMSEGVIDSVNRIVSLNFSISFTVLPKALSDSGALSSSLTVVVVVACVLVVALVCIFAIFYARLRVPTETSNISCEAGSDLFTGTEEIHGQDYAGMLGFDSRGETLTNELPDSFTDFDLMAEESVANARAAMTIVS